MKSLKMLPAAQSMLREMLNKNAGEQDAAVQKSMQTKMR